MSVNRYSVAGQLGGQMTPYAVCYVHVYTRNMSSWLSLKTTGMVFFGLASKLVAMVSPVLASKPVARVSWFEPQNR
jgi:hypothetical protein